MITKKYSKRIEDIFILTVVVMMIYPVISEMQEN